MTALAGTALAFTVVSALVDWWATWTSRRAVRLFAKPATLALLIVVALALDPTDHRIRAWMVVGLVLCLAGDVFLMLEERFFVFGLASFLVGHVAYVVAMQLAPTSAVGTLAGVGVVAAAIGVVGRRVVGSVQATDHRELVGPVVAYLLVISAMVVSAFGTLDVAAVVGALLFYVSDATLAWNRFVAPFRVGPLLVMVTYHLGQIGLVLWMVA